MFFSHWNRVQHNLCSAQLVYSTTRVQCRSTHRSCESLVFPVTDFGHLEPPVLCLCVGGCVFECVFFQCLTSYSRIFHSYREVINAVKAAECRPLLEAKGFWTRKWSLWYIMHMYSCSDTGHWCCCGLNLKDHPQYVTFNDKSLVLGGIRRDQGLKDFSFRPTWLRKNNCFVGHAKWREISMFFHVVRL